MTVADFKTMWHDDVAMGLIVLGYGIVAAGFYALIAKTAKLEPDFKMLANSNQQQAAVIDITDLYDQKKAA